MHLYFAERSMTKPASHRANGQVGPQWVAMTLATAVALFAGTAWWFSLREPRVVMQYPDDVREAFERRHNQTPRSLSFMHDRGTPHEPLAAGSLLPPIDAGGWINGRPHAEQLRGKVLIIDVWDDY